MRKSLLPLLLLTTAGFPTTSRHLGGWAVVTVDDLPDYAVAGQPVTLSFVVRQHGMTPLAGLQPSVEATLGNANVLVSAIADTGAGRYVAKVNLPRPGDWMVTIHSGFNGSRTTLPPFRTVSAGMSAPRVLSDVERGRRLFIAKGCFTCHVNSEVTSTPSVRVGPDLTGRRYPAEQLAKFLAHPESLQLTQLPRTGPFRMPNLGLKEREIASLVAMINSGREVSAVTRQRK
jgi:mono/diheme cytochrome c family protein